LGCIPRPDVSISEGVIESLGADVDFNIFLGGYRLKWPLYEGVSRMRRRKFLISLIGVMTAWPFARSSRAGDRRELSLTAAQRSKIWHALGKQARKAQEPVGLNVGEVVPNTMNLLSFGHSLRKSIPAIRLYRYALLHDQVLIVDPGTKKISFIVGQ
jgi:hypothetical protein